jgi:sulfate permease, SulP family
VAREDETYAGRPPFRRAADEPLLSRALPVTRDLTHYRPPTGRTDLLAGMTVAALAIPSAMAYAELAGIPPVNGLYALLLPTVAYALLGSSRRLIIGPEGSLSALVAASVLALAASGSAEAAELAALMALMVGGFFALAWVARLGWLADYLSRPVLVGYIHGVAVVLVVGQLGKLLGLSIKATDPIPQLVEVVRELGDVNGATVIVSVCALAVLVPLRYLAPRVPAALLVVVAAIVADRLLHLGAHGVALVGDVPSGLPRLALPSPPLHDALTLLPAAAGLSLVAFADEILTARAYAGRHAEHVRVGSELLSMGAANAAAGITQGMPVGASGSRTAVNDAMGARSQVAGLLAAVAIVVVLLFLTGPIADLPKAVLGAAIVAAAIGLVEPAAWRSLWRTDRVEWTIAAVTAGGVVISGVLQAIVFAVGLSIVDVVRRSARPHDAVLGWVPSLRRWGSVATHRDAKVAPGVVVYRFDDRLFFANAGYFRARVREALDGAPSHPRWLVIDAEAIVHVDTAGLEALGELVRELRAEGIEVALARLKGFVREHLDDAGVTEAIGAERLYPTVTAAVDACAARG